MGIQQQTLFDRVNPDRKLVIPDSSIPSLSMLYIKAVLPFENLNEPSL